MDKSVSRYRNRLHSVTVFHQYHRRLAKGSGKMYVKEAGALVPVFFYKCARKERDGCDYDNRDQVPFICHILQRYRQ